MFAAWPIRNAGRPSVRRLLGLLSGLRDRCASESAPSRPGGNSERHFLSNPRRLNAGTQRTRRRCRHETDCRSIVSRPRPSLRGPHAGARRSARPHQWRVAHPDDGRAGRAVPAEAHGRRRRDHRQRGAGRGDPDLPESLRQEDRGGLCLPAVNDMEIRVGDRTIKGLIKRREEARAVYQAARQAGHIAALLDQERPNIFTQSVANILPGSEVAVTIRYFETVPYASGDYEFSFPMVVGPRFIPGEPTTNGERGRSPDTTEVPDASRITPPGLRPETRTGHDISLEVRLDAGATVRELASPSHQVRVESNGRGGDIIRLKEEDSIPNRDFVLRYRVDGDAPNLIVLPHRE